MRHAELTPQLRDAIHALKWSDYDITSVCTVMQVSRAKVLEATTGDGESWGKRQIPVRVRRAINRSYWVPPAAEGLHELFQRYTDQEPTLNIETLHGLLRYPIESGRMVASWLRLKQDKSKARIRCTAIYSRCLMYWRNRYAEPEIKNPVPPQLVNSRWIDKNKVICAPTPEQLAMRNKVLEIGRRMAEALANRALVGEVGV